MANFGDGYDSEDSPIKLEDDGTVTVKGYIPTPSTSSSGGSGITIPPGGFPPTVDSVEWAPVIPPVAPPTAHFTFVTYGNYNVQFVNSSLGNIESLQWDFGDGNTSTEDNPIHTYVGAGTFNVQLRVTNDGGDSYYNLSVTTEAPAPSVDFNFGIGGYTVYFTNLSNTTDYLWDFGDGNTSTARDPKHLYAATGDYVVTLKSKGITVQKTVKIDVEILLEWDDNSGDEDGFKIERSPDGSTDWVEIATVGANIESYGVTLAKDGVDSAEVNFFRVRAYHGGGDSGYSNIVNVRCI